MEELKKEKILNVGITIEKEDKILEFITKGLQKSTEKCFIATPNPEILVFAQKHPSFKSVLNSASLTLPDGMGIVWAGSILNKNITGRITGADLMERVCEKLSKQHGIVGFLGGYGGVAELTAECLRRRYPQLIVGYASGEWDEAKLRTDHIDFLFVAFGFPKQEEWIYNNLDKIPVKMAMGVGGAFDYMSGKVKRAPKWTQNIGLEWLFRLFHQPWRWKRQLALIEFAYLVMKERLTSKSAS